MKIMEAIGEAPESAALSPAAGALGQDQASVRALDLSRRRWMRGAAAVAPMVLTLRSGALAAASLTGVKAIGTVDETGKVVLSGGGLPVDGDVCVTGAQVDAGKIATDAVHSGTAQINGTMNVVAEPLPSTRVSFHCSGYTGGARKQVAILSAASASSLTG